MLISIRSKLWLLVSCVWSVFKAGEHGGELAWYEYRQYCTRRATQWKCKYEELFVVVHSMYCTRGNGF